jgi:TetR/AcrR family transcriptional repressor of mexJK operon
MVNTVEAGGRSALKRQAIIDAATALFLRNGYLGTSMDEVAAQAAVSKQTVYKNFADKEGLFNQIIARVTESVGGFASEVTQVLDRTTDLPTDLTAIGRQYLRMVLRSEVLALRRLIVGEAARFPELAAAYYERAPQRFLGTLAECFQRLSARGLLRVTNPARAAEHFAFLVIGTSLDRAMFHLDLDTEPPAPPAPTSATSPAPREATHPAPREATHPAPREATDPAPREATDPDAHRAGHLDDLADSGVQAFLAAYAP